MAVETFVITTQVNTAINVVTGDTIGPVTPAHWGHKGVGISFQSQHATAKVKVGGKDVQSNGGIFLQIANGLPYQVLPGSGSMVAINAAEWWITSDTAATVVVQVTRAS